MTWLSNWWMSDPGPAPAPLPKRPAELSDRCDRCAARPLVIFAGPSGELQFCGHHADTFAVGIILEGFTVAMDRRTDGCIAEHMGVQ